MEHKVNCVISKHRHFRNSGRALNDRQGRNKLELHSNTNIMQYYTFNVTCDLLYIFSKVTLILAFGYKCR